MSLKTICFFSICVMIAIQSSGRESIQPIPFNHKIHTVDNQLSCDTCHQHVFEKSFAGLPQADVCMMCHADDIVTNPAAIPYIELVRRHAQEGTRIPWVRIYQLSRTVYYSHRMHAGIAGLDCSVCHGDIGQSTKPPTRPIARTLSMNNCSSCHVQSKAEFDCSRCHR